MHDDVGEDPASVGTVRLPPFGRNTHQSLGIVSISVVFAVDLPSRKPRLEIHRQAVTYASFVHVSAKQLSIHFEKLSHRICNHHGEFPIPRPFYQMFSPRHDAESTDRLSTIQSGDTLLQ